MTTPARAKNIGGIRHYPDLHGRYLPSVTAVLKVLDLSVDGIISWASNIGVAVGQEMADADFADAKRAAHAKRREAAKRGDVVHEALEDYALGRHDILDAAIATWTPDAVGYVEAGISFVTNHVAEVLAVEVTMLGECYAGSCDLVVRLTDGRIAVVDWKTGKASPKHHLQLAAYWGAPTWVTEDGDGWKVRGDYQTPDTAVCVYLHEDGTYDAVEVIDLPVALTMFTDAAQCLADVLRITTSLKRDVQTTSLVPDGAGAAPAVPPAAVEPPAPSAPVPMIQQRRDAMGKRMALIEEAGHLAELVAAGWPQVRLRDATDADLDAMGERCSQVEQNHRLPLPDPDPRTDPLPFDHPTVRAVQARAGELPKDLLAVVRDHMKGAEIPPLGSGKCTEAQVVDVSGVVDAMHLEHTARVGIAREAAERVASWTDLPTLLRLAGAHATTLTEDELEAVVALAAGIECGVVRLEPNEALEVVAVVDTDALVAKLGGRREVLSAAKAEAARLGVAKPSKADDVTDPVLAGATAAVA